MIERLPSLTSAKRRRPQGSSHVLNPNSQSSSRMLCLRGCTFCVREWSRLTADSVSQLDPICSVPHQISHRPQGNQNLHEIYSFTSRAPGSIAKPVPWLVDHAICDWSASRRSINHLLPETLFASSSLILMDALWSPRSTVSWRSPLLGWFFYSILLSQLITLLIPDSHFVLNPLCAR